MSWNMQIDFSTKKKKIRYIMYSPQHCGQARSNSHLVRIHVMHLSVCSAFRLF
jgi:hypothetical protein